MSSQLLKTATTMLFSGILLVPSAAVPHAVQDLQDLKTIVDAAAASIGKAQGSDGSWGFLSAKPEGEMGTADLVSNITTTVLRAKYLLDVDKTAWTTIPNTTNTTSTSAPSSISISSTPSPPPYPTPLPTTTPSTNISLDTPYVAYTTALTTLSSALTSLGRTWHKELNKPIYDSISGLQQTMSAFSSSLLQADLIHAQSIIRTIRASSALEDAQTAWSRVLNLPGAVGGGGAGGLQRYGKRGGESERANVDVDADVDAKDLEQRLDEMRAPPKGTFYTHEELWGRRKRRGGGGLANVYDGVVRGEERQERVGRGFVA